MKTTDLTINDLILGNYYHITYLDGEEEEKDRIIIFQYEGHSGDVDRPMGTYIGNMQDGNFQFVKNSTPYITGRNCRPATYEEEQWLRECIKKDRLIPKKINLYYECY